jgi:hypothetical protein
MTEYIKISEIKFAPFNGATRTEAQAMTELIDSIRENGFFEWRPVIIGNDNTLGDGHRRVTAAKILGIEKVPFLRANVDSQVVYSTNASGSRPISGADLTGARAAGLSILPNSRRARQGLARAERLGLLDYLAANRKSYALINYAVKAARLCGMDENDPETMRKITKWMVETESTRYANDAIQHHIKPEQLRKHIETGKPLRPYAE